MGGTSTLGLSQITILVREDRGDATPVGSSALDDPGVDRALVVVGSRRCGTAVHVGAGIGKDSDQLGSL